MKPLHVRTPEETDRFFAKFAEGHFGVLSLVSPPGYGKSTHIKKYLPEGEKAVVLEGHSSPINLFTDLFVNCAEEGHIYAAIDKMEAFNAENEERPPSRQKESYDTDVFQPYLKRGGPLDCLVIDDCKKIYQSPLGNELLKVITDTREITYPTYNTNAKELRKIAHIKRFGTKVRSLITTNSFADVDRYFGPIIDRGPLLILKYSDFVLHESAAQWFLDGSAINQEIHDFVGPYLGRIPSHSYRAYTIARQLDDAGLDWRYYLHQMFTTVDSELSPKDRAFQSMVAAMSHQEFADDTTDSRRREYWMELTGESQAQFYYWRKKWEAMGRPGDSKNP